MVYRNKKNSTSTRNIYRKKSTRKSRRKSRSIRKSRSVMRRMSKRKSKSMMRRMSKRKSKSVRRRMSIRKSRSVRRRMLIRKSRSARRMSIRKSRSVRRRMSFDNNVNKPVKKSTRLTIPLTIYTSPGCPACEDIQKMCKKKGIEFRTLNRKDYSEYVNKNTGNCMYVPNVFNKDNEYIGGNEDLLKLTKSMKNVMQ